MIERRLFNRPVLDRADTSLPVRVVFCGHESDTDQFKIKKHIKTTFKRESFIECSPSDTPRSISIIVGNEAILKELGRKIPIQHVRRGIEWQDTPAGRSPAYWIFDQAACRDNKFIGLYALEDIAHFLSPAELSKPAPCYSTRYYSVSTEEDADFAMGRMRSSGWCAYDCETAGIVYSDFFEISCLAVSTQHGEVYYWDREALTESGTSAPLIAWLCDPTCKKVGHNIKFDMHAANCFFGVPVRGFHSDTRLKRKLLQADADSSLELCSELVGMGGYKQEFETALGEAKKLIKTGRMRAKKNQLDLLDLNVPRALTEAIKHPELTAEVYAYSLVDPAVTALYCCRDAYATCLLERQVDAQLSQKENLRDIWEMVVKDSANAFTDVETAGILVDRVALSDLQVYLADKRAVVKAQLAELGLQEPDSSQEVAEYLFEELELKPVRFSEKTKRPSTDAKTLKALQNESEQVSVLMEYRRLSKLADAYGESLPAYVRPDGRIRPEFKLDGTRTGRLSCCRPGLHQIPRSGSDEGTMIKNCFIAPEGMSLIALDYSQMELRVAAMLSGDKVMKEMFESGEDFHLSTARLIAKPMWGMDPNSIVKKSPQRSAAKWFNFGLLYGMTLYGLSKTIGCSVEEAEKLERIVFGEMKDLKRWVDDMREFAEKHGFTYTWWDGKRARIRPLPDIGSNKKKSQKRARNAAINTPVQGTASDYCLASVARIHAELLKENMPARIILSVHDSIILEADKTAVMAVAKLAKHAMLDWPSLGVPLQVDCDVGDRWGAMTDLSV